MLEMLRTFCAVAQTGSLNKAAEIIHLTQPAITRQMKALEAHLGVVLFMRTRQGMLLTPAGQAVLKHATDAVSAVAACEGAAHMFAAGVDNRLRLSAGLHVTLFYLPRVLARYRERWPRIGVDLHPDPHRRAIERLLTYEVDIALVGFESQTPGVRQTLLLDDPLVLITAPDTENDISGVSSLQGRALLVLQRDSSLRKEIDWVLEQSGVSCNLIEFPSVETLKTAVSLGMGVAIVPRLAALGEAKEGTIVIRQLDWPEPVRQIRALTRVEGRLAEPAASFLQMLREDSRENRNTNQMS